MDELDFLGRRQCSGIHAVDVGVHPGGVAVEDGAQLGEVPASQVMGDLSHRLGGETSDG